MNLARRTPTYRHFALLTALVSLALASPAAGMVPTYVNFESGPVQPLALSADGTRLFAVNTPDNRLEVFQVDAAGILHLHSIPVGMEPVSVATRANGEVWVVNHLSDSVSIVDPAAQRVTKTLIVGDEPRGIVFAGPGFNRAFIATAHRGQQRTHASIAAVPGAGDPELTTPGVGRADVWVFDANAPGDDVGGVPLEIITLFGDSPRALAATPDGASVFAAIFQSGNRTAAINSQLVCDGFDPNTSCLIAGIIPTPGGVLPPAQNHEGFNAPEVGLIVRFDEAAGDWVDLAGRLWNLQVRFNLPDLDVFRINATTLNQSASFSGVGTTNFNMAVHPTNGKVYISTTHSQNFNRFEGPGTSTTTVQGDLARSGITVIDNGSVLPRFLNRHINYSQLVGYPLFEKTDRLHSLATPTDIALSSDGGTLYVAAFGSSKVGVYSTTEIDNDTFLPPQESENHITVSGGGPGGLAVDDANDRLYVWTRFDNGVSVVDLATGTEIDHQTFHSPEPAEVITGRPFLYDADATSANGEASCAACHIFGDNDQLSWDLGDPDGNVTTSPLNILNPAAGGFINPPINGTGEVTDFHPMKGPMTTQTLRGMQNHGALHWRGDRANGFFGIDPLDADLSFRNFIVAFEGLVGREAPISEDDMQKFSDFALSLVLPPNPNRAIDNSLTTAQQAGRDFWFNDVVDGPRTCNDCHLTDAAQGFFGTGGDATVEGGSQVFKVAHIRNAYTKVGMFGLLSNAGIGPSHQGDQIRGFGYSHDGSVDSLFRFVSGAVFNFPDDQARRDMEAFMLAFDNDIAPVVGQQVTLTTANTVEGGARLDTLIARADTAFTSKLLGGNTTECDVIAKGTVGGSPRGWERLPNGTFRADNDPTASSTLTDGALRALVATEGPVTYTCVPPGSGHRMAVDRDEDTVLDGLDNCPDAANPGQEDLDLDLIGDACDPLSCGDGFVGALEECDDGGVVPGDGCSATCTVESGFSCEQEPSQCFIDSPIDAKKLVMKRSGSGKETLSFVSSDDAFGFPALGGPDDPATGVPGGMTVEIISETEGVATFTIPPGLGSPIGWFSKDAKVDLYKYKNKNAPGGATEVKTVVMKDGKSLKVKAKAVGIPMAVPARSIAIRITTGVVRSCARFEFLSAIRDEPGNFLGKNATSSSLPNCSDATLGVP